VLAAKYPTAQAVVLLCLALPLSFPLQDQQSLALVLAEVERLHSFIVGRGTVRRRDGADLLRAA
jgi:hypothetical protein